MPWIPSSPPYGKQDEEKPISLALRRRRSCNRRALIGERDISIKTIGVRPGEKIHEILISEEEIHHCVQRGAYYAIQPMLPELRQDSVSEPNALVKEYSSGDDVLDLAGTADFSRSTISWLKIVIWGSGVELLR